MLYSLGRVISLVLLYSMVQAALGNESSEVEIGRMIGIINQTLTHLRRNLEEVTFDIILGVLLTNANLQRARLDVEKSLKEGTSLNKELQRLEEICDDIGNRFWCLHPSADNWLQSLLDKNLWNNSAEDFKYGSLNTDDDGFLMPEINSCIAIADYSLKGNPQDSDKCVSEIFTTSCRPSDECWRNETDDTVHHGYKTTHRLFYLLVASKYDCINKNPEKFERIKTQKKKLCQKMFLEANAIENEHFPLPLRDLFLEQIAFCGLEGYVEFAQRGWIMRVSTWRTSGGCLGHTDDESERVDMCVEERSARRTKRSDSLLKNGCRSHTIATGVSAMAFHLRFLIHNELQGTTDLSQAIYPTF